MCAYSIHVLHEQELARPRIHETEQSWVGNLACETLIEKTLTKRWDTLKKKEKKKKKVICCTHSDIRSHEFYAEKGLKMQYFTSVA